jgi:hypothetical protein
MATVDFLLIGAQKAGTTSLFEYMRRHPEIYMPPEKEVSFFDRVYDRGPDWYLRTALRGAPPGAVCGEASVGYMGGAPFGEIADTERWAEDASERYEKPYERVIPHRIRALLPDAKLICVLRDPVERAYSHYLMSVLDGIEARSFDDAISSLIQPHSLEKSRAVPTDTNSYIAYGEYARVLTGFTNVFPRDQLLVLYSDELNSRPAAVLESIFRFLGVTENVALTNLDVRYRTAALKPRVKGLNLNAWQTSLARWRLARRAWHMLPESPRRGIDQAYKLAGFRVAVWNAQRNVQKSDGMPKGAQELLTKHYRREMASIAEIVGRPAPWRRWQNQAVWSEV